MSVRYSGIYQRIYNENTRWQQSSSMQEYFYFIYLDCLDYWYSIDWQEVKDRINYFMDSFSLSISIDDIILFFTIFTLFGREIETLSATEHQDQVYENMFTISFVIFSIELIINSYAKTEIHSWYPFQKTGYFLSFYWWLDVISIVSLFPDVNWIANHIGIGGLAMNYSGNSQIAKAGQVVRLVRLVRIVRILKIAMEKRQRQREQEELYVLYELGIINEEDMYKQTALTANHRNSKLGAELSDHITRKVIIMILIMIIILPLLTYTGDVDDSAYLSMDILQSLNVAYAAGTVSNTSSKAIITQLLLLTNSYNLPYHYLVYLQSNPLAQQLGLAIQSGSAGSTASSGSSSANGILYDSSAYTSQSNTLFTYYTLINGTAGQDMLARKGLGSFQADVIINNFNYTSEGVFTERKFAQQSALYEVILIIFVGIMMVAFSIILTIDAERLVLRPIERMMNMVEAVAANPLAPISSSSSGTTNGVATSGGGNSLKAAELADLIGATGGSNGAKIGNRQRMSITSLYTTDDAVGAGTGGAGGGAAGSVAAAGSGIANAATALLNATTSKLHRRRERRRRRRQELASRSAGDYETKLLETTIEKVTGLLRVGFGEAGAAIISHNLSAGMHGGQSNNSKQLIDPLLPGIRIYAIFGFCDIHGFEEVNRLLNKDILLFVNRIAEIVHSNVANHGKGSVNKNLGNAFVCIWRIGDETALINATTSAILSLAQSGKKGGGGGAIGNNSVGIGNNNNSMYNIKRSGLLGNSDHGSEANDDSSNSSHRPFVMRSSTASMFGLAGNNNPSKGNEEDDNDIEQGQGGQDKANGGGIDDDLASTSDGGSSSHGPAGSSQHGQPHHATTNRRSLLSTRSQGNASSAPTVDLRRVPGVDNIAHGALMGYLKVIADINRSRSILRYRQDRRLWSLAKAKQAMKDAWLQAKQEKQRQLQQQQQIAAADVAATANGTANGGSGSPADRPLPAIPGPISISSLALAGSGGLSGRKGSVRFIEGDTSPHLPVRPPLPPLTPTSPSTISATMALATAGGSSDGSKPAIGTVSLPVAKRSSLRNSLTNNSTTIATMPPSSAVAASDSNSTTAGGAAGGGTNILTSLFGKLDPHHHPSNETVISSLTTSNTMSNSKYQPIPPFTMNDAKEGESKLNNEATVAVNKQPAARSAAVSSNRSKQADAAIKDESEELQFQEEDFIPYKVRMGFGLHAGWAIEGSVGSIYKVDATYLSPHVNMAARLETSSRQYQVPLLLSHSFVELLNTKVQQYCRKIDMISVKGSNVPSQVYTYDVISQDLYWMRKEEELLQMKLTMTALQRHSHTHRNSSNVNINNNSINRLPSMTVRPSLPVSSSSLAVGPAAVGSLPVATNGADVSSVAAGAGAGSPDSRPNSTGGGGGGGIFQSFRPFTSSNKQQASSSSQQSSPSAKVDTSPAASAALGSARNANSNREAANSSPSLAATIFGLIATSDGADNNNSDEAAAAGDHDNDGQNFGYDSIYDLSETTIQADTKTIIKSANNSPNGRSYSPLQQHGSTLARKASWQEQAFAPSPQLSKKLLSAGSSSPTPDGNGTTRRGSATYLKYAQHNASSEKIMEEEEETDQAKTSVTPAVVPAVIVHRQMLHELTITASTSKATPAAAKSSPIAASASAGSPTASSNNTSPSSRLAAAYNGFGRSSISPGNNRGNTSPIPTRPSIVKSASGSGVIAQKQLLQEILALKANNSHSTKNIRSSINPTSSSKHRYSTVVGGVATSRSSITSSTASSSNGGNNNGYRKPLPLPGMGTQHSATTRLILTQVHKELMQSQKRQEKLLQKLEEQRLHTTLLHQKQQQQQQHQQDSAERKYGDDDDPANANAAPVLSPEELYQAAQDYIKTLYPEIDPLEMMLPPFDTPSAASNNGPGAVNSSIDAFAQDIDLLIMRVHITESFKETFDKGLQEYFKGNWMVAKKYLEESDQLMCEQKVNLITSPLYYNAEIASKQDSLKLMVEKIVMANKVVVNIRRKSYQRVFTEEERLVLGDGPSQTLLSYMKGSNYIAPEDWKGFRPLTSK